MINHRSAAEAVVSIFWEIAIHRHGNPSGRVGLEGVESEDMDEVLDQMVAVELGFTPIPEFFDDKAVPLKENRGDQ